MEKTIMVGDKRVMIFAAEEQAPLVVYHSVMNEDRALYDGIKAVTDKPFHLATIGGCDWNRDMSPWAIPKISPKDTACSGGADEYSDELLREILPRIDRHIPSPPLYYAIAGYSLAGLFAIYSLYRSDRFSRAASCSGSLWYPNIAQYIFTHELKIEPNFIYFSLGDREHRTKNEFLAPVRDNTEKIERFYAGKGIPTEFVLNKGDHYDNATQRTAAGIARLLEK